MHSAAHFDDLSCVCNKVMGISINKLRTIPCLYYFICNEITLLGKWISYNPPPPNVVLEGRFMPHPAYTRNPNTRATSGIDFATLQSGVFPPLDKFQHPTLNRRFFIIWNILICKLNVIASSGRWLTLAARLLRLYISETSPSEPHRDLVTFIVEHYVPMWFVIRHHSSCTSWAGKLLPQSPVTATAARTPPGAGTARPVKECLLVSSRSHPPRNGCRQ